MKYLKHRPLKKRPAPGEVSPSGDTHTYAQITVKIAWGDLYRLHGRAIALGVSKNDIVRRAIRDYLYANEADREIGATVSLPQIVAREFEVPLQVARLWVYSGRVLIDGEVVKEMEITVPPTGIGEVEVLERSGVHASPPRGDAASGDPV